MTFGGNFLEIWYYFEEQLFWEHPQLENDLERTDGNLYFLPWILGGRTFSLTCDVKLIFLAVYHWNLNGRKSLGQQTAGRSKTKQADHWKPFGRNPLSFPKSSLAPATTRKVKLVMKLHTNFSLTIYLIYLITIRKQHVLKMNKYLTIKLLKWTKSKRSYSIIQSNTKKKYI